MDHPFAELIDMNMEELRAGYSRCSLEVSGKHHNPHQVAHAAVQAQAVELPDVVDPQQLLPLAGLHVGLEQLHRDRHRRQQVTLVATRETEQEPVAVWQHGKGRQTPGVGGVWDEKSSLRMRLRNWVALFNEMAFIFWNTSYARDGHSMNIWLGPQERQYVRAMQDFAQRLDKDVRMAPVTVSDPKTVRGWALASPARAGVYLHHFANHTNAVSDLSITLEVPKSTPAYWYSPENAAILRRIDVPVGRQSLVVPPFTVDVALLLTPDGPPDIDHDGKANDEDLDDDNDGVPDLADAFPLDPEEWADKDGDLIGDNMDADIDADGVGDDKNKNGIPDFQEMDYDGDGVLKANAVPWDAFPLDPKEWRDTDGDGLGDNADPDDDGDGWTDEAERQAGTDPLDRLSFPRINPPTG